MKRALLFCLLAFAVLIEGLAPAGETAPDSETTVSPSIVENLESISVTIKSNRGEGSGVIFTRGEAHGTDAYVWTAAHVVESLRRVREVIDTKTGTSRKVVEFQDAAIVQELNQEGRRVGEIKMDAEVIRYSDAEQGEDLALLRVRKRNFVPGKVTATFYLEDTFPPVGTELYHVGSLLGQVGANSLTTGIVSQTGRVLKFGANSVVFDQTTVTAFPGSSGGGVFLKEDGRYMGMLVRGAGEQFNLIVPVRRIREWAKRAGVEWAIDPNVPMPTVDDLRKLPIEDSGLPDSIRLDKYTPAKDHGYLLRYYSEKSVPEGSHERRPDPVPLPD